MGLTDYEQMSVATDVVVLASDIRLTDNVKKSDDYILKVLLVMEPRTGKWSLPGGFVDIDKTIDEAAKNKLELKTGISNYYQEQLYTYGDIGRDDRGRVISVSYLAILRQNDIDISKGEREAKWFTVGIKRKSDYSIEEVVVLDENNTVIELAYDHANIIKDGVTRIANKVLYTDIAFYLLPEEFTLRGLQDIFELLMGKKFDNFRRFIAPLVEETGNMQSGTGYRPSKMFRKKIKEEQ